MKNKPLIIKKTVLSPAIILDSQKEKFIIAGKSAVENAHEFYKPILNWFETYFKNPNNKTSINFYIEYLNSSSSVQLGKIFNLLSEYRNKYQIEINWHYEKDDEIMKDTGIELQNIYDLKFNFSESDF